ncbi:uncharacterized protein LOC118187082 [Stegodyphus dumicola]|uniref:uncharacterized protein LOC118187082 n=1 Tax=Stegodyphus dumicola TaxID=202533 RepID=UPI0015ABB9A4|nr:uncharacterized protein LOC118187082 [Stegodyphus dumicola]
MENRKETTIEERKLAVNLSNQGKSLRKIGEILGRIIQKFRKDGTLENQAERGRKKILSSAAERRIVHKVRIDPTISAPKIAASTSETVGKSVSAETVRRILRRAGYNGRKALKKLFISKINRAKRLKFAKEHILKPKEFWNEVFSAMRVNLMFLAVTVIVWCGARKIQL